jgi:thioredoxin-related protein
MILFRLFFVFIFIISNTLFAADFTVKSLEEAKTLSNSTNQPILLIFGSPECSFCTNLTEDIRNGVLSECLDPYIICYIDLKENSEYKKDYKVSIIPDSRIILKDKQMSKATGYTKSEYIQWLKNAKR